MGPRQLGAFFDACCEADVATHELSGGDLSCAPKLALLHMERALCSPQYNDEALSPQLRVTRWLSVYAA